MRAKKKPVTLSIQVQHAGTDNSDSGAVLLLTKRQIVKIEKTKMRKKQKDIAINMSRRQLRANMTFKGGFLGMLAGLAARALPFIVRALPTLLTGLASGLVSGAVEKATSGGDGLFLHKGGTCHLVHIDKDGTTVRFERQQQKQLPGVGDGLWLKQGHNVYDGKGLILGANSPFKHIPILGWIL